MGRVGEGSRRVWGGRFDLFIYPIFILSKNKSLIFKKNEDLIKFNNVEVIDLQKNSLVLDRAFMNVVSKKLIGKDVVIEFKDQGFEKNNEPRLKGNTISSDQDKTIIKNEFADVEAVAVWGGEDNPIPDYGKVYISIKPLSSEVLTAEQKATIITNILKPKNVVSITPVLIDPEYTYIDLEVFFKFNHASMPSMITSSFASSNVK